MKIYDSANGATGTWYRANRDVTLALTTADGNVFGGATVSIRIGDQNRVVQYKNPDRDFTSAFDRRLKLNLGMWIRIDATPIATATSIQVNAFPADALEALS